MANNHSRFICKNCYSEKGNEWQRENPEESLRHKRDHQLRKNFAVSLKEAERMLIEQGGQCAICGAFLSYEPNFPTPHIDHSHDTGVVRALLCFNCNVGLGAFRDNVGLLEQAISYLKKHDARKRLTKTA